MKFSHVFHIVYKWQQNTAISLFQSPTSPTIFDIVISRSLENENDISIIRRLAAETKAHIHMTEDAIRCRKICQMKLKQQISNNSRSSAHSSVTLITFWLCYFNEMLNQQKNRNKNQWASQAFDGSSIFMNVECFLRMV